MMKAILFPLLATATLAVPAPAAAREDDARMATVSTWLLDLSTADGIDVLVYRLKTTIDDMCDTDWQCRDEAWSSADAQVARAVERDVWRRRIAEERAADRWRHRERDRRGDRIRQAPRPAFVPDDAIDSVTRVTEVTTTRTTRTHYRIAYRAIPPDHDWSPR